MQMTFVDTPAAQTQLTQIFIRQGAQMYAFAMPAPPVG
jgi:hypothetical protein